MSTCTPNASARTLAGELWLAERLAHHGALADPEGIFAGLTDRPIRAERMRQAIQRKGLADVVLGRGPDGKPSTYRETFERLYGERLAASPSGAARAAVLPSPTPGVLP